MTYTMEQLEALEKAIALGVTQVSYNGNSQTYRSLEEMRSIRDEMRLALGLSKQSSQKGMRFASFSKGIR